MLQVMLAGLVLSKVLTLEEANKVYSMLKNKRLPDSVEEVLKEIEKAIKGE